MTRYDAEMQHSIVARHVAWPARYVHPDHQGAGTASRPARGRVVHRRAQPPDRAAPAATSGR